ncbi:NAD(P)H oxidoreductase [Rouxiella sp. Mn2063]|uniref:NAD(P)H oxidoreductase n=1 Tax=Rouxiella sp. Mn2063 TaxID=3395262 RepID=UPI003BD0E594
MKSNLTDTAKTSGKTYIIWAHPRADSLTAQVVDALKKQAASQKMDVAELDLYRTGFDPSLGTEDEPDWQNPNKIYSEEVRTLFAELADVDNIIVVFPLWWYSMPAILKGYFDRVWNYGLAYGRGQRIPARSIRWISLVGGAQDKFETQSKDAYMNDLLTSMALYGGIEDSKVEYLYNTIGVEEDIQNPGEHHKQLIEQAKKVVVSLAQ